jgi:hypothetical protein
MNTWELSRAHSPLAPELLFTQHALWWQGACANDLVESGETDGILRIANI